MSGYYDLCDVFRLKRECIVTRRLKLGSRGFHIKVAYVLSF